MHDEVGEPVLLTTARGRGVAVMITLIAGTTLAVLGTAFFGWTFGLDRADLPTRINTVAAVCAFVLVAATLVIALIAYLAATGRPDLGLRIKTQGEPPILGSDAKLTETEPDGDRPFLSGYGTGSTWEISLVNLSRYAARNPGVRVQLTGFSYLEPQPGWTDVSDWGYRSFQWDGGADHLIHGEWSRRLPDLQFGEARIQTSKPRVAITVAADGVKPKTYRYRISVWDVKEDVTDPADGADQLARED